MSKPTSKTVSRAMFDLHRAKWIKAQKRNRPYILGLQIDSEIPTYGERDVALLAGYAHHLEAAIAEAFNRGREQGRKMEKKGL